MVSNLPKISIVTPSYNQAEFIEETILSVINQNYPNLEYIIIDGGSTDGSVDIIKKYEQYYTYWVSEPDKGHADALNKGFAKTTGEIMAWINSDDKYFPWTFATIAEIYSQFPEILWTTGLHANFNRQGVLMSGTSSVRGVYKNIYSYIFREFHIQQESVFWRRHLWSISGGYINESLRLMVDTELWCRFFLHAELWHIDQVIGGYRSYEGNRAHDEKRKKDIEDDINNSITFLKQHLEPQIKNAAEEITKFKKDIEDHNNVIRNITNKISEHQYLPLIPHLYYDKVCNYMYRREMKKRHVMIPKKPYHSTMVFKKLERINEVWIKTNIPFEF